MNATATVERKLISTAEDLDAALSCGSVFFTPERVAAGLKLPFANGVPLPLVTEADIRRMKRLNHCLIWLPAKTLGDEPITMKRLHDGCGNRCHQGQKFLYAVDWYANENLYTEQTLRGGWREISLRPIPKSFGKTFCQQLRVLVDYLHAEWPEGVSDALQAAIFEFETEEQELLRLEQSDWPAAAKREAKLKLGQWLTTPVEQAAVMLVHQKTNGQRFLETVYSRTSKLSSGGRLVDSGRFGPGGAKVCDWYPDVADVNLGVCLSAEIESVKE